MSGFEDLATSHSRSKMMFVASGGNDDESEAFIERMRPQLPHTDLALAQLGPIVGVYTGPNALGIATLERE